MSFSREFSHGDDRLRVSVEALADGRYRVRVGDRDHEVSARRLPDGRVRFVLGDGTHDAAAGPSGTGDAAVRRGDLHVAVGGRSWMLTGASGGRLRRGHEAVADGVIVAPMTGTVLKVLVQEGDRVSAADTVAVVTAMKMEHKLLAGIDGTVTEVHATPEMTVDQDQHLITVVPDGDGPA